MKQTTTTTDLIGNTPLLRLSSFSSDGKYDIFAKLEGQNISGSIKDRVAKAFFDDLEKKKLIKKDTVILEPSSGNTGIGLAMIGTIRGYKVRIMLPEDATSERTSLLRFFGAEVEFCTKEEWKGYSAIRKCELIAKKNKRYVMPNQYENPVCVDVHYKTTGEEIIKQCPDITHLVATIGTGGTITGIGKRLKEYDPKIKIIGVEIKSDSSIPGPRSIQEYIPPILDFNFIDKRVMIEDEKKVFAIHSALARQEGIFYGISSAAALKVAIDTSKSCPGAEKKIVCIFPDRGEKYLSMLQ
ncbi:MAG: cysteine synthase family protein [Patescibacteria group bacterium]|nr:cysteine synthase family protein [Patescibacteria group bacterium]